MTVGFVGLGMLGSPIAARIAEKFPTVAYDIADGGNALSGVERTPRLEDLATRADVICLSLPHGDASTDVVTTLTSVSERRARRILELSTIGPSAAERCAVTAVEAGWGYVDAPVSGGVRPAALGQLSMMVAGAQHEVEASMPIFQQVADKRFVIGEQPGLGQAMKLTNNAIALSVLPITSEALAFGASFGLDLQVMLDVINVSSGRTQRSEVMFPTSIVPGTFDYGARGEITRKDVDLFVEEARQVGSPVMISEVVAELYHRFVEEHPNTDYSYLHRYIGELRS